MKNALIAALAGISLLASWSVVIGAGGSRFPDGNVTIENGFLDLYPSGLGVRFPDGTVQTTTANGVPGPEGPAGPQGLAGASPWNLNGQIVSLATGYNVGIGTAAPGEALDVVGNIRASGNFIGNGSGLSSVNADLIGGQRLPDLDLRYRSPLASNPNLLQIATQRWDQVRGGPSKTISQGEGSKISSMIFDGKNIIAAGNHTSCLIPGTLITSGFIQKINPSNGETTIRSITPGIPSALAFDGQNAWIAYSGGSIQKINPDSLTFGNEIPVENNPVALAFDGTNIWVANNGSNSVQKIDPVEEKVTATFSTGNGPSALVFDGSNIWVANSGSKTVQKIDPITGPVLPAIIVSYTPVALAFDGYSIWIATQSTSTLQQILPGNTNVSANINLGTFVSPTAVAFDGFNIWVTGSGIAKINPATQTVSSPATTQWNNLSAIAFDGSNMWLANNTISLSCGGFTPIYTSTVVKMAAAGSTVGAISIGQEQIVNNAITTAAIVDGAVTDAKISGPISGSKLGSHSHSGTDVTTGTIADGRLSTNVTLMNATQTITGQKTFSGGLRLADSDLYFRAADNNHGLGWYGYTSPRIFASTNLDGPVLYGYGNGALGTTYGGQKIALKWDSNGTVAVTGALSKGSGSFKIDHPLDPKNKYLYHSFVESPDMMNIYNGNITTDDKGFATVEMPAWFEALNREFRYQLTVIGKDSWARARVYEEMVGNRFVIQSDIPETRVSWQVTGIRKDAYAEAHRIRVEENKADNEKGSCLHSEACR